MLSSNQPRNINIELNKNWKSGLNSMKKQHYVLEFCHQMPFNLVILHKLVQNASLKSG